MLANPVPTPILRTQFFKLVDGTGLVAVRFYDKVFLYSPSIKRTVTADSSTTAKLSRHVFSDFSEPSPKEACLNAFETFKESVTAGHVCSYNAIRNTPSPNESYTLIFKVESPLRAWVSRQGRKDTRSTFVLTYLGADSDYIDIAYVSKPKRFTSLSEAMAIGADILEQLAGDHQVPWYRMDIADNKVSLTS